MKRMHDFTSLRVIAGIIAAATFAGTASTANGAESSAQSRPSLVAAGQPIETLRLPPVANLDAVPWLTFERAQKGPLIDTLLTPPPAKLPLWPDNMLAAGNAARNG